MAGRVDQVERRAGGRAGSRVPEARAVRTELPAAAPPRLVSTKDPRRGRGVAAIRQRRVHAAKKHEAHRQRNAAAALHHFVDERVPRVVVAVAVAREIRDVSAGLVRQAGRAVHRGADRSRDGARAAARVAHHALERRSRGRAPATTLLSRPRRRRERSSGDADARAQMSSMPASTRDAVASRRSSGRSSAATCGRRSLRSRDRGRRSSRTIRAAPGSSRTIRAAPRDSDRDAQIIWSFFRDLGREGRSRLATRTESRRLEER